jgi:hypothetical protein
MNAGQQAKIALQEHNAQLQADTRMAARNRHRYFRHHWKVLKPFVAPMEAATLFRGPDTEAVKAETAPLAEQPTFVTGQMRPHQLEGLNWLIERYNNVSDRCFIKNSV